MRLQGNDNNNYKIRLRYLIYFTNKYVQILNRNTIVFSFMIIESASIELMCIKILT